MAQRRRRGGPQCRAHDRDRHGQRRTQTALPDRVGRDRDSHHLGPRLNGQARRRTRGHPSSGLLSDAIGGLGGASEGRGLGPSRPANGGETAEARGRIAPCGRPTKRPRSAPGVGGRRAAYGERGRHGWYVRSVCSKSAWSWSGDACVGTNVNSLNSTASYPCCCPPAPQRRRRSARGIRCCCLRRHPVKVRALDATAVVRPPAGGRCPAAASMR